MVPDVRIRPPFAEAASAWVRSFDVSRVKCLIVCRGPVRKEAMDAFERIGVGEYGFLISEKDSIVYSQCLAPELRGFRYPQNIHRIPDYMGTGSVEKLRRIDTIVAIALSGAYSHIFAGYGFMAEDAEFIEAIERAGLAFMGPSSGIVRALGVKDAAKRLARRLGIDVTPGVDNVVALALLRRAPTLSDLRSLASEHNLPISLDDGASLEDNAEQLLKAGEAAACELVTIEELQAEAGRQCGAIWDGSPGIRLRFKYVGGGGGKGQRVVDVPAEVPGAVLSVLAESKVLEPGSNRAFLIESNIEVTRHVEIQLIGNGQWCVSLGGRDCSVQMHEQKLLELSLTAELLHAEIKRANELGEKGKATVLMADWEALQEMERAATALGMAVGLDSLSTFEAIVDGGDYYFMEVNTRIQVEHRVTEQAYRLEFANPNDASDLFVVEGLIEVMVLLSVHRERLPRPTRRVRHASGAEVRINATNQALQPHAGGVIHSWSDPIEGELRDDQGIGIRNPDTGGFIDYRLAGAYDSNVALVVAAGKSRRDNLQRLGDILRVTDLRGDDLQTNMDVHYGLLAWMLGGDAMVKPTTRFMSKYLAVVGAVAEAAGDFDLDTAWQETLARATDEQAGGILKLKYTFITRPLASILARPHALVGFLGAHNGRLFRLVEGEPEFVKNPITMLLELYRFTNLEYREGRAPCDMIWSHDERILQDACDFYDSLTVRLGVSSIASIDAVLLADKPPATMESDLAQWQAIQQSHAGFQLGVNLLLVLPRIGQAAGLFDLCVGPDLRVGFPDYCNDPAECRRLLAVLAPPPVSSSDEVAAPMGGRLWTREAPHLPPLVEIGDHFEAHQPLFVIEVMKMFNNVSMPFSGTIVDVLIDDLAGAFVHKGQVVLRIEPDERPVADSADAIACRRHEATIRLLG